MHHGLDLLLQSQRVAFAARPDGEIAGAVIAGEALVVVDVQRHRAELAHVITPDTGDKESHGGLRRGSGRCGQEATGKRWPLLPRAHAVQRFNGFAHVHRHGTCGDDVARAHHRQNLCHIVSEWPRENGDRGLRGAQAQTAHALRLQAFDAVELRDGAYLLGRKNGRIVARGKPCCAHVHRRGNDGVEPFADGGTKAADHDRQCDRQTQAGDDTAHRHRRYAAHAMGALDREQGECAGAHERQRQLQQALHHPRQQGDAADQQQADRYIGRNRDAHQRRSLRERRAGHQQRHAHPRALGGARHRAQALECLCGRQGLGLTGRPPATDQRGHDAEHAIDAGGPAVPLQRRLNARKVAAAEIAAQEAQREFRERGPECDAGHTADDAQQARFGQHQCLALARGHAEDGEQGQLRRTLRDAEGEHGIDQKRAGEQRDKCQHREVDAVGAREVVHALCGIAGLGGEHVARPVGQGLPLLLHGGGLNAFAQLQIDAREVAAALEQILCGTNIHHGGGRARCGDGPCDFESMGCALYLHLNGGGRRAAVGRVQPQGLQRCRVEKQRIRGKDGEAVFALGHARHQRGGHAGDGQRIGPENAQRDVGLVRGVHERIELEPRACNGHIRQRHNAGVQRLGKGAAMGAQREIWLALHAAHRARKLVECRRVDELHRQSQGHTQHDRHHRRSGAPRMGTQRTPGKETEEPQVHVAMVLAE